MPFMDYLPPYFQGVAQVEAIADAFDRELADLQHNLSILPLDATIMHSSEERLKEWETILGITPQDRNITQRRMMVLATIRGSGKLNEMKIASIVSTFTGGYNCIAIFVDSTINIYVLTPTWGEIFIFDDIERALKPLIPAHLGLSINRFYSTWQNIKEQYQNWADMMNRCVDWLEVRDKIYV